MTKFLSRLKLVSKEKPLESIVEEYDFHLGELNEFCNDSDLFNKIYDLLGKDNINKAKSIIKKYEKSYNYIKDFFKNNPEVTKKMFVDNRYRTELLTEYQRLVNLYDNAWDLCSSIKIGDNQDKAINNLIKALKKVSDDYDFYSKEDILRQIDEFDGIVKLNGPIDFYINFKDNKVKNKWF